MSASNGPDSNPEEKLTTPSGIMDVRTALESLVLADKAEVHEFFRNNPEIRAVVIGLASHSDSQPRLPYDPDVLRGFAEMG